MELSEETGEIVLTQLQRRSKSLSIPRNEQDDLVQDVAIWIGCHRDPGRPVTSAWLWSVLEKFARGTRRSKQREIPLEDLPADLEPTRPPRRASASLAELTRELGYAERRVVDDLLEGHTWESALGNLGICHGSQSRWRSRIRRRLEKTLHPGRSF